MKTKAYAQYSQYSQKGSENQNNEDFEDSGNIEDVNRIWDEIEGTTKGVRGYSSINSWDCHHNIGIINKDLLRLKSEEIEIIPIGKEKGVMFVVPEIEL